MNKKLRSIPVLLEMEEALKARLPAVHLKYGDLGYNIAKGRAGYQGEHCVDYELNFLPEHEFFIFQDLRLMITPQKVFQLDILVLSSCLAIIIETKNIYGKLFFDRVSKQMIRTYNSKTEGFPDPFMQVRKQQGLFQEWLMKHHFNRIPVQHLIAIGKPSTIVETNDQSIFQTLLHAAHIPDKILNLHETASRGLDKPPLSRSGMEEISNQLLQEHTPHYPFVLQKYRVDPSHLIRGVFCPSCNRPEMIRVYAKWQCPACETTSQDAHMKAVRDYLLLFHTISNEECREFLNLPSSQTAKRILRSMNLPFTGTYRDRRYCLYEGAEKYVHTNRIVR